MNMHAKAFLISYSWQLELKTYYCILDTSSYLRISIVLEIKHLFGFLLHLGLFYDLRDSL